MKTTVPSLRVRDSDSHKGTFGRVLIVGGSRGMSGAVALSASAACQSGAGLVTAAVPESCLNVVAGYEPNYMTVGLPEDQQGRMAVAAELCLRTHAKKATSIGVGPGMSRAPGAARVVTALYEGYPSAMVVDADALNLLSEDPTAIGRHAGARILTPHIGEFRRLIGQELVVTECRAMALDFAKKHDVILVLKGNRTIVSDGQGQFENTTGNPGMATGGSGDVLTGVIAALCGQGYSPIEAAVLGVHVHGLAGDFASKQVGEISVVAETIRDHLCKAFQHLSST